MRFACKIWNVQKELLLSSEGEEELFLVYNGEFGEGDSIEIEAEKKWIAILQ